jgi:hypothetical protein
MKRENIMRYIIVPFISFMLALPVMGQDCTDYHQYHCTYGDYTFFYSRQSKSALFKRGQTSQLKIIAYGGEDYYVAVCAHRKFGELHLRILEDTPEKTVIYDNAKDDYSSSVIFSNQVTRTLIVEVTVPTEDEDPGKDRRCVGVVIQFRKSENTGDSKGGKLGF